MNNQSLNLEAVAGEAIAGGGDVSVSISEAVAIIRTWSPGEREAFKAQIDAAPDAAAAEKALQDKPDLWQILRTVPWRDLVLILGFLISLAAFIESTITLVEAPAVQPPRNVTININVNNRTVIDFSTSAAPLPHEAEH